MHNKLLSCGTWLDMREHKSLESSGRLDNKVDTLQILLWALFPGKEMKLLIYVPNRQLI